MIKNAKITSTMLGREDRGMFTWIIFIKFDSVACGVGGYVLGNYNPMTDITTFNNRSMESISKVLEVVGVNKWEDLPGKYIRFEDNGIGKRVTKIGNIIEDKWFDLKEFFENKL